MKRRDLIKSGVIAVSAAAVGIAGYKKIEDYNSSSKKMSISPKQTDVYKICTPLPFRFELIDEIENLNSELKKSQIKILYNNFPYPLSSEFNWQFAAVRGRNYNINSFDDFARYVKYAQDKGFNFVYLLNSPKPFSEDDFNKYKKNLFVLLENLQSIGCREIKIANTQLMQIISKEKMGFKLSASTSFEYHNVSQYVNLINTYSSIKSINTAIDDNRNFIFLKNLKRLFPEIDIEVMVNEKCMHGCPARISHCASFFEAFPCMTLAEKTGKLKYFLKSNVVYPWQLEYYSAIGINTFKFMSYPMRADIDNLNFLKNYLMCLENGINNLTVSDFFNGIFEVGLSHIKNNVKLSEIMPYLPDMKHFVKNGDRCANICGIDCNYCIKCAEKIGKIIGV